MNAGASDNRPVVMFVAPYFPPAYYGGVVQVYLGLLTRLKAFQIVVVSDQHGCTPEEMQQWDARAPREYGFEVQRIHSFEFRLQSPGSESSSNSGAKLYTQIVELSRYILKGRSQFAQLVRTIRPSLIVCGGTYSAGWLMGAAGRVPVVNYLHGEELTMRVGPKLLMPLFRHLQMRAIRRAQINVAVSTYTARLAEELSGADRARTVLLPNFVDTTIFHVTGRRAELRKKAGWDGKTVLLTLARLEPRKGIDQALRALALLDKDSRLPDNWLYIIAGRGKEQAALVLLSQQLGIEHRVRFPGFVADPLVPELYEAADIFLQPNREIDGDNEGFGVVFLEAAACGLPVIGGKAGGTADAIAEGINGYRVDGNSVEQIAATIERLASDPLLRQTLGSQGAMRVARDFTAERAAELFEAVLVSTLEQSRMRSQLRMHGNKLTAHV